MAVALCSPFCTQPISAWQPPLHKDSNLWSVTLLDEAADRQRAFPRSSSRIVLHTHQAALLRKQLDTCGSAGDSFRLDISPIAPQGTSHCTPHKDVKCKLDHQLQKVDFTSSSGNNSGSVLLGDSKYEESNVLVSPLVNRKCRKMSLASTKKLRQCPGTSSLQRLVGGSLDASPTLPERTPTTRGQNSLAGTGIPSLREPLPVSPLCQNTGTPTSTPVCGRTRAAVRRMHQAAARMLEDLPESGSRGQEVDMDTGLRSTIDALQIRMTQEQKPTCTVTPPLARFLRKRGFLRPKVKDSSSQLPLVIKDISQLPLASNEQSVNVTDCSSAAWSAKRRRKIKESKDILESTGLSAIQDFHLDVSDVSEEPDSDCSDCVTLFSQAVSPIRIPVSPPRPARLFTQTALPTRTPVSSRGPTPTAPGAPAGPGRLWSPPSPVHDSRTRRLSTISTESTGSRHSVESRQSTLSKDSAFSEGSRHLTRSRDSTGTNKSSRHSLQSRFSLRSRHSLQSRHSLRSRYSTSSRRSSCSNCSSGSRHLTDSSIAEIENTSFISNVSSTNVNSQDVNPEHVEPINLVLKKRSGCGSYGFGITGSHPAQVCRVDAGGPADHAGVKPGDWIIRVNGEDVSTATSECVGRIIRHHQKKITLEVCRPMKTPLSTNSQKHRSRPCSLYAPCVVREDCLAGRM